MPALPPVTGGLKIILDQTVGINPCINRLYYHYTGAAPTVPQINTFAQAVHTAYWTHMGSVLSTNWFLQTVHVIDLSSSTAPEGVFTLPKGGAATGPPLTAGNCVMTNFHVNRRYRGGHPRYYQSGAPESSIDINSKFLDSYVPSFQLAIDAFLNAIPADAWTGASTMQHVNISYYHGFTVHTKPSGRAENIPTLRPTPLIDVVVGTQIHPKVTSQRRRDHTD